MVLFLIGKKKKNTTHEKQPILSGSPFHCGWYPSPRCPRALCLSVFLSFGAHLNTVRLATNDNDNTLLFAAEEGCSNGAVAIRGMVEGIKKSISGDNGKALMSMGEA